MSTTLEPPVPVKMRDDELLDRGRALALKIAERDAVVERKKLRPTRSGPSSTRGGSGASR
jgi:hypothetical protein